MNTPRIVNTPRFPWLPAATILALLLVGTMVVSKPRNEVAFLDIGQGDSLLLQTGTQQVVVDGGPGQTVLQRLAEEMPAMDRKVEVLIATHPDKDHLEGVLAILKRYDVGLVLLSYVPHTSALQEAWLRELEAAARDRGTQFRFAWAGEKLHVGDMNISFLWPTPEWAMNHTSTTNNNSLVTRVNVGGRSFLFSGDAETVVEEQLIGLWKNGELNVDILKAGHHGSKTSTSEALLSAATPSMVAISVGAHNTYGHPNQEVLDRLKGLAVARTDKSGTVRFQYDGTSWFLGCTKESCLSE